MKTVLPYIEGSLASIAQRTIPARLRRRLRFQLQRWQGLGEPQIIVAGWERYARRWKPDATTPKSLNAETMGGSGVQHPGDEWTSGIDIENDLLKPYLPASPMTGLEIGPGGGRVTALLLPITKDLHVAEPSETMLRHLKQRFAGVHKLHLHHTDGTTLPALGPASMDYIFSFAVFIHFEPRLIYWYLRQIESLLKPGGTGVINYANVCTSLGWHKFEQDLEENLYRRNDPIAFGVMCPQMMARFLEALELEVISDDVGLIPSEAIAVFRKHI